MKLKRAIIFAGLSWVLIFLLISILMFVPYLQDRYLIQKVIYWVILIPVILLLAKWYFKEDPPKIEKGLYLGLIGLAGGILLDLLITIPFFVGADLDYGQAFKSFYSDPYLYIGFVIYFLTCLYAGFEFDATYTRIEKIEQADKEDK